MVSSACKNCCLRYFPSTSLWRHNYCCWRSNNQEGRIDIPRSRFNYCCWRYNNQEGRVDILLHSLITAVGDPIIKRGESISHGLTLFLMLHVPIQYLKFKCHGFQMSYVMVFLRFWDERWLFHFVNIGGILFQHFFSLLLYYCMTVSCEGPDAISND